MQQPKHQNVKRGTAPINRIMNHVRRISTYQTENYALAGEVEILGESEVINLRLTYPNVTIKDG